MEGMDLLNIPLAQIRLMSQYESRDLLYKLENLERADYGYSRGISPVDFMNNPVLLEKLVERKKELKEMLGKCYW